MSFRIRIYGIYEEPAWFRNHPTEHEWATDCDDMAKVFKTKKAAERTIAKWKATLINPPICKIEEFRDESYMASRMENNRIGMV